MMARVQYLFYVLIFISILSFIFLSISNAYKLQDSNEASQLTGETELNHFGAIAAFFRYGAPGTLTGGA